MSADGARVLLLTRGGIEHRYVASILAGVFPSLQLCVETRAGGTGAIGRSAACGVSMVLDKAGRVWFRWLIRDASARRSALMRHLGWANADALFENAVESMNINDDRIVKVVRSTAPDLVLVYGTGLVRRGLIESVRAPMLNLHTGLSPYYRGTACHLWPLVDGRLDRLGVTVHECVPRLDAGDVLATDRIDPVPGDGVHDVFAKLVTVGAHLYALCARSELEGGMPRSRQELSQGREYRGVELGLRAELSSRRCLRRLNRGRVRGEWCTE